VQVLAEKRLLKEFAALGLLPSRQEGQQEQQQLEPQDQRQRQLQAQQ
jgi:hypothetical protein